MGRAEVDEVDAVDEELVGWVCLCCAYCTNERMCVQHYRQHRQH